MTTSIHIHNLQHYILLFFYLYEVCFSINLLSCHNNLVQTDKNIYHYILATTGIYTLFIIGIITVIINHILHNIKYKTFKEHDYITLYILITPDLFLNLIYFFFSTKFGDYKKEYMNSIIFSLYIIPKLLLGFILLIVYVSFCMFIFFILLDKCCCENILCNLVSSCKSNRNRIMNYDSDDNDESDDSNNNRIVINRNYENVIV